LNVLARIAQTRLAHVSWLATRDLWHQRLASLVLVFALASVLTPLLVLFGLKFGVVDNLLRELVQDPRNREIRLIGHGRFDQDWFARMAAREDVAFVVPRTRGAAATMDLRSNKPDESLVTVELVPSGKADPLLRGHAPFPSDRDSVVISAPAADLIGVGPGDLVQGSVRRKQGGQWSRVHIQLHVSGVLPHSAYGRKAAFVSPTLLTAIEDYRDGYAVPELGWGDGEPFSGPRLYSGFRLYVHSLDDVARVRDMLTAGSQGFQVSTRAKAIEDVKRFDRYLTATFFMIAFIGVGGYLLSFGASMWVNVDRKRRELSVLQLLGFRSSVIMFFPVAQSALISLCGALLAVVLFWLISLLINDYFAREAGQFQGLCRLLPSHLAISLLATLVCAVTASLLAAFRVTRIEPSKGLREI
jgi:putative ABC transport system permease protein